jgi:hypothetical protein
MTATVTRSALTPQLLADNCILSRFLQNLLFRELGGFWNQRRTDVIYNAAANEAENRNYLGTYFPRSFTDSYCIYSELLNNPAAVRPLAGDKTVSVLSLGCGTAGDITGLIAALLQYRPNVRRIEVTGIDVNDIAAGFARRILGAVAAKTGVEITFSHINCDLSDPRASQSAAARLAPGFDFVQSFKAAGELLPDSPANPYFRLTEEFAPLTADNGVFVLLDVCISNKKGRDGRFYPQILNEAMNSFCRMHDEFRTILPVSCSCRGAGCYSKECYMSKVYHVSHDHMWQDTDRVCFRVLARTSAVREIRSDLRGRCFEIGSNRFYCGKLAGVKPADAFSLDILREE